MTLYYCGSGLMMIRVNVEESAVTFKSIRSSSVSPFTAPSKMINTVPIEHRY